MLPEVVGLVLDELDEGDEQPPRVRAVHNQTLQQDTSDLLLDCLCIGLREEGEQGTAEIVGVAVGVPQLVCYGIQEQVAPCKEEGKENNIEEYTDYHLDCLTEELWEVVEQYQ